MKRQKHLKQPKSREHLWLVSQDVWKNIPAPLNVLLKTFCAGLPSRIDAVLNAKGRHTKY